MAGYAKVHDTVPPGLLKLLDDQLPYSHPLLRRLQFTKVEGGLSETARIIFVSESSGFEDDENPPQRFSAAYIDVGGGPDTQMWFYSTLEHPSESDIKDTTIYEKQLARLVDEVISLANAYGKELAYPGAVLLGTVHDSSRALLAKTGRIEPRPTGAYDKWLFRYQDLPDNGDELPEGMHWATADEDDCRVVISRTHIPRTVDQLIRMPSLVIKLDDGTPISWAFIGFDGSLASLHCEEPYRRRGFAKKLAAKLFREKSLDFSDDGWCSADVAPDNEGSRGMCKRLNGKPYWRLSCSPPIGPIMAVSEVEDDAFQYEKLGNPSSSTRILTIHPASSHYDLIECQFEQAQPSTQTATYVVHEPILPEDSELSHAILCNGQLMLISEHTHFFLWSLRNQKDPKLRRVWSSQICINPSDQGEVAALTYKFHPLPTPDSIRLIELEPPGVYNGLLQTRIRTVSLADNPVYYYLALQEGLTSDSWPDKGAIICNNRLFSVSKPLSEILSAVLRNGPRAFWIPAICIDHKSDIDTAHHKAITYGRLRENAKETIGVNQPQFAYMPLPDDRPHIRLLKLLPAASIDDILVADIGHFPLESCPEFVALSYVWGSPDPPRMVCTRDGRYIICTESLRIALRHLRQRGELVVWADAVCINQKDNAEKSNQVLLMGDIYKKASRVVVELGVNCTDENHRVCRAFPPIIINMLSLTGRVLQAVRPENPYIDDREYSKFGIPSYGHQAWSGWRAMRSMPWFTRSWIVQEIAAGKDVVALYNGKAYKWKDMDMANPVTANEQVDLLAYRGKMNMTNMGDLQGTNPDNLPKLLDLLATFRSLDATDPRDKIYAFRGLAADRDLSPLPDYSKPVEQVYINYASFFIKQGLGSHLLSDAGQSRSKRTLPCWVPDWGFNLSWQTFNFAKRSTWVSLNGLQRERPLDGARMVLDEEQPRKLRAWGYFVDEVVGLSSSVSNTFDYSKKEHQKRIDREILDLFNSSEKLLLEADSGRYSEQESRLFQTLLTDSGERFKPLAGFYSRSRILGHQDAGPEDEGSVKVFDERLRERLSNRCFCLTRDGRMGLVPAMSEVVDAIVWFEGVKAPMILREEENNGYVLIGDSFIADLMSDGDEPDISSLGLALSEIVLV
ncbi:hypothetical protein FALBO_15265 [Fusarium albosuccineum]|uniref:Heterokaryon incompatibility domain-containing protein n=1 Tax=Fusarium albosuccineum TaxID=1237068 RepID=A0A8H4KTS0_9HYPO|nr:hypothetical protein FALBO_15265 [Fusarium albosuccineum]